MLSIGIGPSGEYDLGLALLLYCNFKSTHMKTLTIKINLACAKILIMILQDHKPERYQPGHAELQMVQNVWSDA
jgi:hypothetical protein